MSLPTLQKAYNFFYNPGAVAPSTNILVATSGSNITDNQVNMFKVKDILKNFSNSGGTLTNKLVIKGSCNGSGGGGSFGNNDNVDRWTTSANLIWSNSAGVANHSWIVFECSSIATHYQFCIDLNGNNSANNNAFGALIFSPSAGFFLANGGTDGAANARPTASDEITVFGGGTVSGTRLFGQQTGPAYTTRIHAMQSTDGEVTRIMVLSGGTPLLFWNFEKLRNPVSGFTKVGVCGARCAQSTVDSVMTSRWWTSTGETGGSAVFRGPGSPGTVGTAYWTAEGFVNGQSGSQITVANEIDGNWPFHPMGFASLAAGVRGRHGQLFDIWYGSTGVPTGDDYPSAGTHLFAQFGQIIVPWDGSVPTIA